MNAPLVKVEHVSKRFCKSLKRSLWYGLHDIATEVNPFASRAPEFAALSSAQSTKASKFPQASERCLRHDEFWAVRDVSFELRRGECLGLIGQNGAGKSTLLKMLNGLIKPDEGRIEMRGRVSALIELGAGFNPILTGRENIYNRGAVLGFRKREIDRKFDAIVDFAEIGDFLDMPVQNYSSGMKVRLGFAVSAQMAPDVLIIDEVLAVGDLGFTIKCLNRMSELLRDSAAIFVSHSMPMVSRTSNRLLLLTHGTVEYHGPDTALGIARYLRHFPTGDRRVSGAGKARVGLVALLNGRGENTSDIQSGEPCALQVSVLLDHGITDATLSVYIYNEEVRPVANLVSLQNGPIAIHSANGDEVLCTINIPGMYLKMGHHSITVIVGDRKCMECLARVDCALKVEIRSDHMNWADTVWPCSVTLEAVVRAAALAETQVDVG